MINKKIPMHTQLKISVIIAMKNAEKCIERAVDSIISQTLVDIEIIVVDDNSSDKSITLVKKYCKILSNISLYQSNIDIGPGSCRNIGLTHAQGEYIAFVDSDDFIATDFLATLYQAATKDKADIAVCGYDKVTETEFIRSYLPSPGLHEGRLDLYNKFDDIEFIVCNKLYRRAFLKENKLQFSISYYGEDWLFCFQAMFLANRYSTIAKPLYYYYQRSDSLTHHLVADKVFNELYAFFTHLDAFICTQELLTETMRQHIEESFCLSAISCYIDPIYTNASAPERFELLKNIPPSQLCMNPLHIKIIFDVLMKLYAYVKQNIHCDTK